MSVDLLLQLANLEQSLAWSRNADNREDIEASMKRLFTLIARLMPDVEAGKVRTAIKLPASNKTSLWPAGWETNDGDFLLAEGSLQLPLGHEFLYKYKLAEPVIQPNISLHQKSVALPPQTPNATAHLRPSPAQNLLPSSAMFASPSQSSSLSLDDDDVFEPLPLQPSPLAVQRPVKYHTSYTIPPMTPPPEFKSSPTLADPDIPPGYTGCDPRVYYEHYQATMLRTPEDSALAARFIQSQKRNTYQPVVGKTEEASPWQKRSSSLPLPPPQPLPQTEHTLRRTKKGFFRTKALSDSKVSYGAPSPSARGPVMYTLE